MMTLCIECSSQVGSVALVRGCEVVAERTFVNVRGRGTELFRVLAELVEADSVLERVVVGTGPGSYNALRSSISAAWGIAVARGVPVHGVCSLLGYDHGDYTVLGDARAGQWFYARVANGELADGPRLVDASELGDGGGGKVFLTSDLSVPFDAEVGSPLASRLARFAASWGPATPIYLKPPHITKAKEVRR